MSRLMLINELMKRDCKVQNLRLVLTEIPNLHIELNKAIFTHVPLSLAIRERQNVDIIEELIRHGADVNFTFGASPLMTAFRTLAKTHDTNCFDTIKLLFKYGANINANSSNFQYLLWYTMKLESGLFALTLPLVLQLATNATNALYDMFPSPAFGDSSFLDDNDVDQRRELENSYRAAKLLLESGAHPDLDMLSTLLRSCKIRNAFYRFKDFDLVMDIFKLFLPYIFIRNSCKDRELMVYDISNDFRNVHWYRKKFTSIDFTNVLIPELKKLWNECLEQWHKLRCDILADNGSVLKTMTELCETNSTQVTSSAVYGMLLKFVRNEYPHFADVMRHALENSDLLELYSLTKKQQSANGNMLTLDSFYHVMRHLTKGETLSYVLALFPVKI